MGHRLHRLCGHHTGACLLLLRLQKVDIQEEEQKEGQGQGKERHQHEGRDGRGQNRGKGFRPIRCSSNVLTHANILFDSLC